MATSKQIEEKNYYEILEILPSASQAEVERAYKGASQVYTNENPASYSLFSSTEFDKMKSYIEEAYAVLSSHDKRSAYNKLKGLSEVAAYDDNFTLKTKDLKEKLFKHMKPKKFDFDYDVDPEFENAIDCAEDFDGDFLKKVRLYKNVTLEEIAKNTKILKSYLVYIEENQFDKLPAFVYTRGFVYQYAKSLKLNPDLVSKSYLEKFNQSRIQ